MATLACQPSDLLARYTAHWHLRAEGPPFYTASSVLQPVRWRGQAAMLKIALSEEVARGNRLMAWRDGRQSARVFGQHGPARTPPAAVLGGGLGRVVVRLAPAGR